MSGCTLTIHQPNFMPYMGFFEKMAAADILIVLTECQYEKGGYQNRFQHQGRWYTMGVQRQGSKRIADKQYIDPDGDWAAIKRKVQVPILDRFDRCIQPSLWECNTHIITMWRDILGIEARIEPDFPTHSTSTMRLVEICQYFNASTYISGPSGRGYLDLPLFEQAGIEVSFFEPTNKQSVLEWVSRPGWVEGQWPY